MGIQYFEDEKVFKLDTKNTSYILALVDEESFVGHAYYGRKLSDYHVRHLMRLEEGPFVPSKNNRDRGAFGDAFPFEYSTHGVGDYRESCLKVQTKGGHEACSLVYRSHRIFSGKPALSGLPATFGSESECSTLELTCLDPVLNLEVVLVYSVFEDVDAITRSARIINYAENYIVLKKALSACLTLDGADYEYITLHGSWARERHIDRRALTHGKHSVSSLRGESSHQEHPFIAVMTRGTTQEAGEVYAMNFVYSGNFLAQVEGCQFDTVRMVMGINPENFSWTLKKDEEFTCPEVVMVYSDTGLGKMTRTFHDLYRNHLIRGEYRDKKRPILINNWEATYFNFNTDKLLAIAKEASKLGIEMLVMDDGWFGHREDDNSSLGDWYVNEKKLPGGLKTLVDGVNALGMKFGIWFEPEMISPDSDLYHAHPDWAIQITDRTPCRCRNQFVLDISRKEVRDYIYDRIKKVLSSANVEYVKWDMNRPLTDLGSTAYPTSRQGELSHRYMLGVYEMQERLITDFPHLLLENCSGGGGRFDAGMLYYYPQIWCSDDTDAYERTKIQYGTSFIYPISAVGSHISVVPNHQTGRITPIESRAVTAMAGSFGYELDLGSLSDEEKGLVSQQIKSFKKYGSLIHNGKYYRLSNPLTENSALWEFVSEDKTEALIQGMIFRKIPNMKRIAVKAEGLSPDNFYKIEGSDELYTGKALMCGGILLEDMWGDYRAVEIHLIKDDTDN